MKVFFLLFLLVPFQFAAAHSWNSDFESALREAKEQDTAIFLDFYTDWCQYCARLRREVYPTSDFENAARSYVLVSVNGEEQTELGERFQVHGYPTLLMLDKNGVEIARVEGYISAAELGRNMRQAYRQNNRENEILNSISEHRSLAAYFQAGVYYTDARNHRKARDFFLQAWSAGRSDENPGRPNIETMRINAIYNTAVSSMEIEEYSRAVSYWSVFIRLAEIEFNQLSSSLADRVAFARFYRGMCYQSLNQYKEAAADFRFAATNLPGHRERSEAARLLQSVE